MRPIFLFDLDDTVICSKHRQNYVGGDLDLPHWRENSTPAKIMLDSELPLAQKMREAIAAGLDVIVLTSRVLQHADRVWLKQHEMLPPLILGRHIDDHRSSGPYKLAALEHLAVDRGVTFKDLAAAIVMFDDDLGVQKTLRDAGIRVIDPIQDNLQQAKEA